MAKALRVKTKGIYLQQVLRCNHYKPKKNRLSHDE